MINKYVARVLSLLSILTACCGRFGYVPQFSSKSPDGHDEILILRNLPGSNAEYHYKVVVRQPSSQNVIYENERSSALGLIEAHWTEDGSQVGLLICNMFAGPKWISYDFLHKKLIDSAQFRSALEDQLRRKYSAVVDLNDVTRWACSSDGNAAYKKFEKAH